MTGSQKERMLRGELYLADDPELRADEARCDELLGRFNATRSTEAEERRSILVELLGSIGEDAAIRPPLSSPTGRISGLRRWSHAAGLRTTRVERPVRRTCDDTGLARA